MSTLPALKITAGPFVFDARLEAALAPKTCEAFQKLLPYRQRVPVVADHAPQIATAG